MNSNKKTARIAGFLYLLLIISGFFSMEYIPSKIVVWEDPAATMNNVSNYEWLFRFDIVITIIMHICFILLSLALYQLLKKVEKNFALLMVIFVLIGIPISYQLLIKKFDILKLISDVEYLKVFQKDQIQAQVMLLFSSYESGFQISQIFWGLWLFPFGYLVFKSGFLPKFLGICLMLGCFGYLFDTLGRIVFINYFNTRLIILPASIGEIGICLWLLIAGIKEKKIQS